MYCGDEEMRHIEGILITIIYLLFLAYAYSIVRYSFPNHIVEVNRALAYYIIIHKHLVVEDFLRYLKNNPSIVFVKINNRVVYSTINPESYTTINFVFLNNSRWIEVIIGVKC